MAAGVVALKVQQAHHSRHHDNLERDRDRDRQRDRERRRRREDDQRRRSCAERRRRSDSKPKDGNDEETDPEVTKTDIITELEVVKKLQEGSHMELELKEVEEFAKALGTDQDGKVKLQDVLNVLTAKLDPPVPEDQAVAFLTPAIQRSVEDGETVSIENCSVMPMDLHWALTHGKTARMLKKSRFMDDEDKPDINVKLLVDTVVKITNRHDAFMTLPITAFYMCLFVVLVMTHLRIWPRQTSEKALEEWVNGRDPRTNCENNVDNMEAFWEWFLGDEDGIKGVINFPRPSQAVPDPTWKYYTLANNHVLIGDMKIIKSMRNGAQEERWLLHSGCGQEALQAGSADEVAAWMAAQCLMTGCSTTSCIAQGSAGTLAKWDDPDIATLVVTFVTYNERAQMFGLTSVNLKFYEWASVYSRINSEVVAVQAYPSASVILAEVLFVIVILWMTWVEGKDMLHSLMLGCGEFKDYWQFWNCVDWVCILLGMLLIITWLVCTAAMHGDGMRSILDDDGKLMVDLMALDEASVERVMSEVDVLQSRFRWLHLFMAANTVSIVAKFFKAFTSNPRLKVVTDTFKHASTDFAHFFIIFFTIFLPFTIIGHVLFGNDLEEFSSIGSSFNTGMQVMLGDFAWYVGVMEERSLYGETAYLPSGVPVIMLFIWLASYMFLVFLVLLNVLLAIIIKHQTHVDSQLGMQAEAECPTIWKQVADYIEFRKRSKGFKYSLEHVRRLLENDDEPAHGEDEDAEVTENSLKQAFQDMSEEQAAYHIEIMRLELASRDEREKKESGGNDPALSKTEFEEFRDKMSAKVDEISEVCNQPLDKSFGSISRTLSEVLHLFEKLQSQQSSLGRRVDELQRGTRGSPRDDRTVAAPADPLDGQARDERAAAPRPASARGGGDGGARRDPADDRRGKRRRTPPDAGARGA